MSIEYQLIENSLIVRLAGELDLVAAARFKQMVEELLDRRPARNLYINMAQVTFLDSSFLGALLGRYKRVRQEGGRMAMIAVPATVRPALELSGLFRMMGEYATEPEALTAG